MPETYDLKSIKLPRMTGSILKVFTNMLESPATRWLLIKNLLKQGGILTLHNMQIDEPPTFLPPVPPAEHPSSEGQNLHALSSIVDIKPDRQKGFNFSTIIDYSAAYRSGIITPEAVAERVLAAIDESQSRNPSMSIFIAWQKDDLMAQARSSTQRIKSGNPLSIMDGVPVPVKDEVDMLPFGTTVGTSFLGKTPVKQDSTVVARMRAAGALMIGKCNMHEIGIGVTGQNPHHGTVRNPYNPNHHTGGSSSGPAAAVAAGFGPVAIGADGGGSIRLPAGFCGVVGLKPTFSRVCEFGAAPLCWSVAHLGPIAATVHDAAIGYSILAGPDPNDSHTINQPEVSLARFDQLDLSDLTLGIFWPWFRHATQEVISGCEVMLKGLQSMGVKIREVEIPGLEAARVAHVISITSEMNAGLERYYKEHHKDYSFEVRINLSLSRAFTPQDYIQSQRIRTRLVTSMEQVFKQVDIIVTPTSAVVAPPILPDSLPDGDSNLTLLTEIMRYATPANLTGHPAITFPAGYTPEGLPIGFQAIGRYWQEHTLLRLAHAAEKLVERRKPLVYYDLLG
jgi:Asp-tRNA(Asn)/Glu-tRNA(Gln) amidotransferase A subunit family amidase